MVCPGCGAENAEDASYCGLCLRRFPDLADATCESPAAAYAPALPQAPHGEQQYDYAGQQAPPPPPGLAPPPPPSESRRKGAVGGIGKALAALLAAAFFALGYLGVGYFLKHRTSTYKSSISAISFKYPGSWKKMDPDQFSGFMSMGELGSYNEILLADSTDEDLEFFLGVGSTAMPAGDWDGYKESVRRMFSQENAGDLASEVRITDIRSADSTVGGAPALELDFDMDSAGYDFDCRARVVNRGDKIYLMLLLSRAGPGPTDSRLAELLGSVEFK